MLPQVGTPVRVTLSKPASFEPIILNSSIALLLMRILAGACRRSKLMPVLPDPVNESAFVCMMKSKSLVAVTLTPVESFISVPAF